MGNSIKIILAGVILHSMMASAQQAAPQSKLLPSVSSIPGELSRNTNAAKAFLVFIRGKDRAYTPEEIVNRAKIEASARSPNFSFVNADVVVSIDAKQTDRLAAVVFSHGFGRPIIKATIGHDGTIAAYTEGILQERTSD